MREREDALPWPSFEGGHGEQREQGLWDIVEMKLRIRPFTRFLVDMFIFDFQVVSPRQRVRHPFPPHTSLTCNLPYSASIYRCRSRRSPEISTDLRSDLQETTFTLNSWTPMQANMNCSRKVTSMMFPMVLMATTTHCTTCYERETSLQRPGRDEHLLWDPSHDW